MGVQKIKARDLYPVRVLEQTSVSLLESVDASIQAAREHVGRSFKIVAQSRELVDRTRKSMARANHIRQALTNPAYNPAIVVAPAGTERQ
ncbi:MAG TPA: hypothetical protein VKH81_11205 [Candidatus Angelobacter sp.]|nr:hypothetical protein [Candidatus Angelobacter sp.]